MEKFITKTEKIPFYRNYDIIAAGGGVAGVAAALSAARQGNEVYYRVASGEVAAMMAALLGEEAEYYAV